MRTGKRYNFGPAQWFALGMAVEGMVGCLVLAFSAIGNNHAALVAAGVFMLWAAGILGLGWLAEREARRREELPGTDSLFEECGDRNNGKNGSKAGVVR